MVFSIDKSKCIYCGACVAVCPVFALRLRETLVDWDQTKCIYCGNCGKACPTGAITVKKE